MKAEREPMGRIEKTVKGVVSWPLIGSALALATLGTQVVLDYRLDTQMEEQARQELNSMVDKPPEQVRFLYRRDIKDRLMQEAKHQPVHENRRAALYILSLLGFIYDIKRARAVKSESPKKTS